jgi:F-type H+-transporting ATPase subunit delta
VEDLLMAETFDKQIAVADVYAEALFSLARDAGRIGAVREELDELARLERISPEFSLFMGSRALDDDHREAGLERLLRGRISDVVLNTLLVMNRRGRIGLIQALRRAYVIREEAAAGQVEVYVTSAVELDDHARRTVQEVAARVSGQSPVVSYRVDPSLLGGLRVQIGEWRYDNTLRRQLDVARRRLEERAKLGLPLVAPEV